MKELLFFACLLTLTDCSKPDLVKAPPVETPAPTAAPVTPAKAKPASKVLDEKKSPDASKAKPSASPMLKK